MVGSVIDDGRSGSWKLMILEIDICMMVLEKWMEDRFGRART